MEYKGEEIKENSRIPGLGTWGVGGQYYSSLGSRLVGRDAEKMLNSVLYVGVLGATVSWKCFVGSWIHRSGPVHFHGTAIYSCQHRDGN